MTEIKDPTTQLRPWPHLSSDRGQANLELGICAPPEQAGDKLPERYGTPQLEVLVVDPEYLFLSWEITGSQLDDSRRSLGSQLFDARRLVAIVENKSGNPLAEYELYGELGRWFIRHTLFGERIRLKLLYKAGVEQVELYATGFLELPRISPVEPDYYQEIEVIYGIGIKGQLILRGFMEDKTAAWPKVSLKLPAELFTYLREEHDARVHGFGNPSSPTGAWLPSSPGNWPSSPLGQRLFACDQVSQNDEISSQPEASLAKEELDD